MCEVGVRVRVEGSRKQFHLNGSRNLAMFLTFVGGAQFVGIELYSQLKDYLHTHLEGIKPVSI